MPKAKLPDVKAKSLAKLLGKRIVVYVNSGKAIHGILKEYDATSLLISGLEGGDSETTVLLENASTYTADRGRPKRSS